LEAFHLRKPHYTTKDYENYLKRINPKYRKHIVLHSRHQLASKFKILGVHISKSHKGLGFRTFYRIFKLRFKDKSLIITTSFSRISSFLADKKKYQYVLMGPIFNSVSKKGKKGQFKLERIPDAIKQGRKRHKVVYATGGVDLNNIEKAKELGFDGVAITGSIWLAEDPLAYFKALKQKCDELRYE